MTVSSRNFARNVIAGLSIAIASTLTAGWASSAFGGGGGIGHSHSTKPASKEEILDTSKKVKDKLITDGKIAATWKDIAPEGAEQKEYGSKKEWVVTFKDPMSTDKAKERLYLFFSVTGNYLTANHTGK